MFAVLHDQFLANAHPGFSDSSGWPLHDRDVRGWKDRLLYQIRRFREIAGRRMEDAGPEVDPFGVASIPDEVERENLGVMGAHIYRQLKQQSGRSQEQYVNDLVPAWESRAATALVPGLISMPAPTARIYVYDEALVPGLATLTRAPGFCTYNQWGMDVGFHDFFRTSPARTFDPEEADYFFVPTYACCHQIAGLLEFDALDVAHEAVVRGLPYFARSGGRDHVFSFHYVDLFPGWRRHIPSSVFLTPETEVGFERSLEDFSIDQTRFPPFSPTKDLSVPPFINMRDILGFHRHAKPVAGRAHLGFFAGKLWRDVAEAADVRGRLAALAGRPGLVIHAFSTIKDMLGPDGMQTLMGDARFCFVPRGRAAWSVRFFESLWAGCVPVVLSDHYEPPFDALFDLTEFVIKWPMARIDASLIDFLAGVPPEVVQRYADAAKRVRCWYLYPPPEVSWLGNWEAKRELEEVEKDICPSLSSTRNAYQAVLQLLTRRKRRTRAAGAGVFYMPDAHHGHANVVVTNSDFEPL